MVFELSEPGCDPARSLPGSPVVTRAIATAFGTVNIPHSLQCHSWEEGWDANTIFWDKPLKSLLSQSHSTQVDDSLPFCLLALVPVQLCQFFFCGVFSLPALTGVCWLQLSQFSIPGCEAGEGSTAGRLCHLTAPGRASLHQHHGVTHGMESELHGIPEWFGRDLKDLLNPRQ